MVPASGVDLTLTELQDMAARQQQQIDQQQQQLVAKEQRLKFLKQQELRHQQIASENDRLRKLRERVDMQELKLKKLRAVRGQVTDHKHQNNSLSTELESIKALFNEKEKELALAVARVEDLSTQLEELRHGRINGLQHTPHQYKKHTDTLIELDKLRKELMLRNKLNEQQNSKLSMHREALSTRKTEMAKMDSRIAELQARLRKKKQQQAVNHNQDNKLSTNQSQVNRMGRPIGTQIAAVEPMQKVLSKESEDMLKSGINKQDPKYQSLPFSIKIGEPNDASKKVDIYEIVKNNRESIVGSGDNMNDTKVSSTGNYRNVDNKPVSLTVQHVKQDSSSSDRSNSPRSSPAKPSLSGPGSRLMSSFAPKPYGTSYASSVLSSRSGLNVTAETSSPSLIYTASGMPSSDPLDSPMTSTPMVQAGQRPSAREMFLMGKQPPPQLPQSSTAATISQSSSIPTSKAMMTVATPLPTSTVTTTTTTTASTSPPTLSTTTKPSVSTTKPAVVPVGGKFFPPLTVDTSISSGSPSTPSPSGVSPRTSAIVRGASYPVYQVAQSTVVTKPSQQVSQEVSSSMVKSSQPQQQQKGVSPLRESTPPRVPTGSPSRTKEESPVQTPPGKIQVVTSQKVQFSERLQSVGDTSSLPLKGPQLSPNNNTSHQQSSFSSSNNSTTTRNVSSSLPEKSGSGSSQPSDTDSKKQQQDANIDTSPPSVSSAISVLMSGGTTTTSGAKPSYRYAPRSVIANTYMSKLGSGALEQYRKNMNQIYASFPAGGSGDGAQGSLATSESNNNSQAPSSPNKTDPAPVSPPKTFQSASPVGSAKSERGYDQHSNGPPPYPGTAPPYIKENAERLKYRPNAPRPLRRRLSSGGDSPPEGHKPPNRAFHHDVIRVNNVQDTYNNNFSSEITTSFSNQVDNLPFADEGSPRKYQSPTKPSPITGGDIRTPPHIPLPLRKKKTSLKSRDSLSRGSNRRVSFDPLALLLDASLEGELDLVRQTAGQVPDPSQANDEGITALHNAICAGHFEIVKYLVEFGCNVNSPDSDGWTPLHCAASCNNLPMVKLLVEHGACIFATTISDHETAAEKCEEDEDGYDGCSDYLYSIQEKLGIVNQGVVYAVFDYESQNTDELCFSNMDAVTVLRKGDDHEKDWWWARGGKHSQEGYIPRNLLGLYPRVPLKSQQ